MSYDMDAEPLLEGLLQRTDLSVGVKADIEVALADVRRLRAVVCEIRDIAAREWKADETNYEWYGDIAGIAEQALGLNPNSPLSSDA